MSLITYLTRVHFADRVLEDALPEEIARNGIERLFVVSETEAAGGDELDRMLDALPGTLEPVTFISDRHLGVGEEVARAFRLFDEAGCDGIIGFGGMRALDLARLVGDLCHPVIAIPTSTETIGLGPIGSGLTIKPAGRAGIPAAILCDATLTTAADPASTAAAGMDALVHCLESFLSTTFNPPADGMALDGLRRAALHLEAAVADGSDLSARRELLAAALNAGLAAEKGFGGIEAAAHGLEATTLARHGVLHGALLSEVLTFNAPAVSDRFAAIRMVLGLSPDADIAERLAILAERVGLPVRLSEIGIGEDLLPRAARRAAADHANRTNPRHATAEDYEAIMRAVL